MLSKQIKEYIEKTLTIAKEGHGQQIEIFQEEKDFAEKHQFISLESLGDIAIIERKPEGRFTDAYIERSDKETEEFLGKEDASFLEKPLSYLKHNKKEFLYVESPWFEMLGVDAVSLEVDDVFGTYDVMLGLKLKKNLQPRIKEYLNNELKGDDQKFDLMFSPDEGLWNLNFTLDCVKGFQEDISLGKAYVLIYRFLFKLVESVEEA
jgi:hypothetical protein